VVVQLEFSAMKKHLTLALAGLFLALTSDLALAQEGRREAPGTDGARKEARKDREGRRHRRHRGRRQRGGERRDNLRKFAQEQLGITEQQKAAGREAARQLAPIAEETRTQAREIVERARALRDGGDREGARELLRNELRPLLEAARDRALPITRPLIDGLSQEQRAKIEEHLQRRGRSFDADRAAARLAWRLSRRR
jgi:hypothetical protein